MKLNTSVAKTLLMAASIGMVVPLAAQTPAKPKTAKPAAPAAPADEEEPKIEGIEIARSNGTFIGAKIEGVRLVLKFYDKEKKPVAPDAARAAARWNPINKKGEQRSVLNPDGSGVALASTPTVQPPWVYIVYVSLLDSEGSGIESFTIDLRKLKEADGGAAPAAE